MSIYKQKKSGNWHIRFVAPDGTYVRHSARSADEKQAREYHDRLKAELWRVHQIGDRPIRSFDDAAVRWLQEKAHKKSLNDDKIIIRWWRPFFEGMALHAIKSSYIQESIQKHTGKAGTKNKHLAILRAMLRKAEREWDWIERAPAVKLFPVPKGRVRWLTKERVQALIKELPVHQRAYVVFALATGLRQANVLGLRWDRVDLDRRVAWVDGEEFKNGENHGIPLNETAIQVLRSRAGQHETHVFCWRGNPIKQANTKAWRAALKRAGIDNFRWHDLRHVSASWLVQDGTPIYALQEIFGWKSQEMARRYAHLAPQHLAEHAAKLDDMLQHSFSIPEKKATRKGGLSL
ncbi:site-specific integrase [Chitinimonas arctica]|uniref:Site-specific integrase n=1 Tax=Chitinimonas arctica TaxID=2594795 RepID=A0A516SJF0_9NEIS|nr:site-specific integrase [Chitinimonas arctica]QDQ28267.1 site-specific integrase [Chitinimonas arctica]